MLIRVEKGTPSWPVTDTALASVWLNTRNDRSVLNGFMRVYAHGLATGGVASPLLGVPHPGGPAHGRMGYDG